MYIERLHGKVVKVHSDGVVVDVGGVGYGLQVPLAMLCEISAGEVRSFFVETYVRENLIKLFGFLTEAELELFKILVGVSGVGPKVALAILSNLSPAQLDFAVRTDDLVPFSQVPGIGPRSAEKILVSLKSKRERIGELASQTGFTGQGLAGGSGLSSQDTPEPSTVATGVDARSGAQARLAVVRDVKSALENLGYKAAVAGKKVDQVLKTNPEAGDNFQELMKATLAEFRSSVF